MPHTIFACFYFTNAVLFNIQMVRLEKERKKSLFSGCHKLYQIGIVIGILRCRNSCTYL